MLRLIRSDPALSRFDGRFFERDALFWPLSRAAGLFAEYTQWPEVAEYDRLFEGRESPVRFELQAEVRAPKPPRRADSLYDACIMQGRVPTRAGCWHDFLNALVWATFPRAKRALHARQHAVVGRWLAAHGSVADDGSIARLPNARTREHDALALIDEGGVVVLSRGAERRCVVFGHAIFEGLVMHTPSMIARAVEIDASAAPVAADAADAAWLGWVDERLADRIAGPLSPELLPRLPLVEARS